MDVPQKQRAGKTKTETQEAVNTADMGKAKPRPCNKTTDTGHGYIRGGRVKRTGSAKLHKDEVRPQRRPPHGFTQLKPELLQIRSNLASEQFFASRSIGDTSKNIWRTAPPVNTRRPPLSAAHSKPCTSIFMTPAVVGIPCGNSWSSVRTCTENEC